MGKISDIGDKISECLHMRIRVVLNEKTMIMCLLNTLEFVFQLIGDFIMGRVYADTLFTVNMMSGLDNVAY